MEQDVSKGCGMGKTAQLMQTVRQECGYKENNREHEPLNEQRGLFS